MRSRSPSVASQRSPSFSRITFILPRMTKKISSTSVWMCIGPVWPAGISIVENVKCPAGHIGPMHIHTDVEEIFFVMRGKMKVILEKDGERWEATLGERDLISVPPGVYREEHNIGEEDALMCVMLGAAVPITPTYPPDSPLAKIKRAQTPSAAKAMSEGE